MKLTLTAAGIVLLEVRVLEQDDDVEEPAASTLSSTTERAEGAPYGFRPSQDTVPWEDR